jgi:uncharacterized protein YciI
MFLILLHYKQSIEKVDAYLLQHRAFLEEGYKNNCFIVSGPQNPRTGGVIISQLKNREQLETLLQADPFYLNQVADYEIIEFTPVKYHQHFSGFIEN